MHKQRQTIELSRSYYAIYSACLYQSFIPAAIQAICLRIRLAARLVKRHCWNEQTRSASDGFGGGVAGAQPLHKGGRLRPTAHKRVES